MAGKLIAKYINDIFVKDTSVGDGLTTTFTLSELPAYASSIKVYLNGVKNEETTDYTTNIASGSAPVGTGFNLDVTGNKRLENTTDTFFNFPTSFSSTAWINMDSAAASSGFSILAWGRNSLGNLYRWTVNYGASTYTLTWEVVRTDGASRNRSAVLSYDTWYFITGKYDDISEISSLSIDGAAYSNISVIGGTRAGGTFSYFRFGSSGFTGQGINGKVDEFTFMDSAISDTLRDSIYNSGNGKRFNSLTPAEQTEFGVNSAWFSMDSGASTHTDDNAGYNLNLVGTTGADPTVEVGKVGGAKDVVFNTAPATAQEILVKYIKE